ncbi:MAG: methyl-accepting chemotaxis protein, partial [Planctomycetota bacterium]
MNFFRRAKLATTLWAAFAILLALSVTQSLLVATRVVGVERTSLDAVQGIERLAADLRAVEADAQRAAGRITQLSDKMQTEVAASMTEGESEMRLLQRNVEGCVADAAAIVDELETLLDSGDLDDDTAGAIEDLLYNAEDSADRIRKQALPIVRSGVQRLETSAAATRQAADDVAAFSETISGFADTSKQSNGAAGDVAADIHASLSMASDARFATILALGVVLVIGIGVPLALVPRISGEVRRTVATMERVAAGELDQRIESRAFEEFGRTAKAINQAVESMATAVQSIRAGSTQLASSSLSLADTADALSDGADRTTELSVSVASASEEMSISMGQVASSVEGLSGGNREIAQATDEMLENLQAVSTSVERATGVACEAAEL